MTQQVNFYRLLPEENKLKFSNERLLITYGIFIVLLCINSAHSFWSNHKKSNKLAVLQQQLDEKTKILTNLTKEYPLLDPKDLQNSMQQLQKGLAEKGKVFSSLTREFSIPQLFSSLASTNVPALWLTEITVLKDGELISIKGQTSQTSMIQQFLDQIEKESIFKDKRLKVVEESSVNITHLGEQHEYFNFYITNEKMP